MTSTQAAQLQAIYDNLGSISVDKGSYTFTFTFSTTFNSYTGKTATSSDTLVIPTFGASKILIDSNSGCTLTGDVSGTLSNNQDISNDTMITIKYSNSGTVGTVDGSNAWTSKKYTGNLTITLEL